MSTDIAPYPSLERILWYEAGGKPSERISLRQTELLRRTEPLIVLGEAGMGKSHLLRWLGSQDDYALCSARQLINSPAPGRCLGDAHILVIDALDELAAQKDGDAVDLVLRKLGELDYPRFVLACRVADWRSATGCEGIREQYDERPTELHLEALTCEDINAFLDALLAPSASEKVVAHFEKLGLGGLLGNPQTLILVGDVARTGELPQSRHELFEKAVELMRREENPLHRETGADRQPTEAAGLDAAGAAFAALILTGREAVARAAYADDIPLQEIAALPGGASIQTMLGTRLFCAVSANRFSYWHRSIGEFLGARWLARQANTPRKRRRLLALMRSHGLVPANLRGIHAMLAHDPNLAPSIIESDSLGLVEYGDTDTLSLPQARQLLAALKREAANNPHHHAWQLKTSKGLFHPELIDEIRAGIISPQTPFWLRQHLIRSAQGTGAIAALHDDFRHMLTDATVPLRLRMALVDTAPDLFEDDAWREIMSMQRQASDADATRLALHILDVVGHRLVDDAGIAELVIADATADERVIGNLFLLERHLPADRLDGVLDSLAAKARALGKPHERRGDHELTGFTYALLARRLEDATATASQLWAWLEPFEADAGYRSDERERVAIHLRDNDSLRYEIQRLVLLDNEDGGNIWQRSFHLARCLPAMDPSSDDVVALLQSLHASYPNDSRWRELTMLHGHDASVRAAAMPFATGNLESLAWLDTLANPPEPEWKREHDERVRVRNEEKATKREAQRADYLAHIDEVRAGKSGAILGPAEAYLRLFRDIDKDLPPHRRIATWLSEEVAAAAHVGFEAFLQAMPAEQTAADIVKALCEGKSLRVASIIVAALAERVRNDIGLGDLPDECMLAGFFALHDGMLARQAGLDSLEIVVESEIRCRGLYEQAMRQYCEPQLRAGRDYCSGLDGLMGSDADAELATRLALDWLDAFEELSPAIRQALVSRVVHSPEAAALHGYLDRHAETTDEAHRLLLDACDLLVDFDRSSAWLAQTTIAPELLWQIRDLTQHNEARRWQHAVLNVQTMAWIFAAFRTPWPMAYHPTGGWSGDQNPWDASEYLMSLLRRLATDHGEPARDALQGLLQAPHDDYSDMIASLLAEQVRMRAEAGYLPPTLQAIDAALRDTAPVDIDDLQAVMLDELAVVQAKIESDDAESWRGFYAGDTPCAEEPCRDHLLGLLRQGGSGLRFAPETHVAADKEVDITCSSGTLLLPIEVKGQWHRDLWHAADTQLDRLYASDWRAERRGIYLVLWFGEKKPLTRPDRGKPIPRTPAELQEALTASSQAARDSRVAVVVLDVSHAQI